MSKLNVNNIKKLTEQLQELEALQNRKLVNLTINGSMLYGLNVDNSDYDFVGIFLPSNEDLYKFNQETLNYSFKLDSLIFGEVDVSLYDIRFFIDLSTKSTLNVVPFHLGLKMMENLFVNETGQTYMDYLEVDSNVKKVFEVLYDNRGMLPYYNLDFLHASAKGYLYQSIKSFEKTKEAKYYARYLYLTNIISRLGKEVNLDNYLCLPFENDLKKVRLEMDGLGQLENKTFESLCLEMNRYVDSWVSNEREFKSKASDFFKEQEFSKQSIKDAEKYLMSVFFK